MAGLCSLHQKPNLDCRICQITMTKIIAFTVRPGYENAINTGNADVYVVPDQPMSIKAFYDQKELAKWLVRYNVKTEITRIPSDTIECQVIGDITA